MTENKERYKVISLIFVLGGLVLSGNLFVLQVVKQEYRSQAQNRTLTKRTIVPSRGFITDRNGELLVVNEAAYDLDLIFGEKDPDMDVDPFCKLLEITPSDFELAMSEATSRPYFRESLPIKFMNNIGPEVFSYFQEHLHKFPGFYPTIQNKRSYPYPNAAHVLGFLGEVSARDIAENPETYAIGEYKGITGIERTYDKTLRGTKGTQYLLKDNLGREIESFMEGRLDSSATNGASLRSTLDIDLQSYAESLMVNKKGSIVAIEPSTGEILAMVSAPGYDPNLLSLGRQRNITYLELLQDTLNKPLFNRSLQAKYPPGSIFKPIFSLIALHQKTRGVNRPMVCTGEYVINEKRGYVQKCRAHPRPNGIASALQHSCNTYYYQLLRNFIDDNGVSTPGKGLDILNEYLYDFGLGQPLGIDLMNESSGFVPTPTFYDNIYLPRGDNWRSTYILSLGIGQGELELTTVQMANLAAVIANRGYFITPHLVKESIGSDSMPRAWPKNEVGIDSLLFTPVIRGMEWVISGGTGFRARVPGVTICGKTGTSQNPHGIDHSVFFAFAPKDDPKIALAVYLENAGDGGVVAAPIAGLVIEKYLRGKISDNRLYLEQSMKNINLLSNP